jgi:MOSC domain-containing protein YiiM
MGFIHSIVYRPKDWVEARGSDRFVRTAVAEARLLASHGIEGDAKAGRHPLRQLNVISYAWLAARRQEGYRAEPGDFGEQLVIEGIPLEDLPPGTRLRLGTEAEIEITHLRIGCAKVEQVQGGRPLGALPGLHGAIGVLARVTHSGIIRVGDLVACPLENGTVRGVGPPSLRRKA